MSNYIMGNKGNFNQALWLGLGQLCTFALSFVSAAILSRYFDKTEYGTYKQILYVYNTLSSLFLIGLPSAFSYFIPRLNTGQQKTLISSINRLFLLSGAIFSLLLYCSAGLIADLLKNPELVRGIRIFSPFPLFTLPAMGVEGIYTALRKTKITAFYQVVSKLLMLIFIVVPVIVFHTGYEGAIIGWGIASFVIFLVAMYLKSKPFVNIKKELVENQYRQIFGYCLPMLGAFIGGFFVQSSDQFFISRYFGTKEFAVASNGLLSIPIAAMISSSVRSVLLPLFSKASSTGSLKDALTTYNNATTKCITLVFPLLLFCAFFSSDIMSFIYGKQYCESGIYMKAYIGRDFLQCLPYFSVLMAIGCTSFYMISFWGMAGLIWLFDFVSASMNLSPVCFVAVNTFFHLVCSVASFIFIYKKTGINLVTKTILKHMSVILIHGSLLLFIIRYLTYHYIVGQSPLVVLIVSFSFFYISLFLSGKIIKINYFESVKLLFKR